MKTVMEATGRMSLSGMPARDWAAAARTLEDDGVVHLKGALVGDALRRVEAGVEFSLANPTDKAINFYPQEKARFFEDTGQRMLPTVREAGIDAMVGALWGGVEDLWYLGEQLFLKEGGFSRRTPWHQDTSYLRMMGSQLVAAWVVLDPLPRAHSLEFVRGSHKGVLYNGSAFAAEDDTHPLYKDSTLPRLPNIEAERERWDILGWDLSPGDILVFHLGILHGGAGTTPDFRRRTVSLRFLGPNVVFDGRPRDMAGAQAGNDAALADTYSGLHHGDPFHRAMGAKIGATLAA